MTVTLSGKLERALQRAPEGPSSPPESPAELVVTDRAFARVGVLLEREGVAGGALRVGLRGGGCAGYEYVLKLESGEPRADDLVLSSGSAQVRVDPKSLRLLRGSTLDFTEGLNGRGFEFLNPNAVRTCGCGTSFSA